MTRSSQWSLPSAAEFLGMQRRLQDSREIWQGLPESLRASFLNLEDPVCMRTHLRNAPLVRDVYLLASEQVIELPALLEPQRSNLRLYLSEDCSMLSRFAELFREVYTRLVPDEPSMCTPAVPYQGVVFKQAGRLPMCTLALDPRVSTLSFTSHSTDSDHRCRWTSALNTPRAQEILHTLENLWSADPRARELPSPYTPQRELIEGAQQAGWGYRGLEIDFTTGLVHAWFSIPEGCYIASGEVPSW